MELSELFKKTGDWLTGTGPDSDIVISTRIRLARNASRFPFLSKASNDDKKEIERLFHESISESDATKELSYINLDTSSDIDKMFLVERHVISKEHAEGEGERGVAFGKSETVSLMINEEDHLRIQVLHSGLELNDTWKTIEEIDNGLEKSISFAFSSRFGYLTACPTNVGTGMRVSVMLHLPALSLTKHIEKVFNAVSKLGLVVRGFYGEGTKIAGDLYQISNQFTLGKSEQEILEIIKGVIPRITGYERMARDALVSENKAQLEDRVWRSYGILKLARIVTSEEILHLVSQIRLGVNIGIINGIDLKSLNELFILTLPGHLQKLEGRELDANQRDVIRASFVRNRLNEGKMGGGI
ncbi:MAG: protein arginine kinase [Candidatus Anammoxibacter sp.]